MRIFILITILFFSSAPAAIAAEASSFEDLLARLRAHPAVQAYAGRAESLRHYAAGERGLPDPMLNFGLKDYPLGGGPSGMRQDMIGFRQEIPRAGMRRARSGKMEAESRQSALAGDYALAMLRARLIAALAERSALREQQNLLEARASLYDTEKDSIRGRVAADLSGVDSFAQAQAESAEIEARRAGLESRLLETEAELAALVGDAGDAEAPPAGLAAWDGDVEKTYPVLIAGEDIARARGEVDLREAEFGPNFALSADYGRMDGGAGAGTVMLGVSVPLWSAKSQQPRLAGAGAALRAARLELDNVRRETTEKLARLRAQADSSGRKIAALESKAGHLDAVAAARARAYGAGKADFGMVLSARRQVLSARMELAEERARLTALIADFNSHIVDEGERT